MLSGLTHARYGTYTYYLRTHGRKVEEEVRAARWGMGEISTAERPHFGKLGSHHLKREFYFDVHPPLGKMLVGLAGLLSGYGGRFEFKSGEVYPGTVPYVAMRVLMVPLAWFTSVELGLSQWACHLTTLMVLLDVGWPCISCFILLDSLLFLFTFLTVWLFFAGISIGCVTSVKMIGLFVTALVGVYTAEDLWDKVGDTRLTVRQQFNHRAARVVSLIVVPVLVFMASFNIHVLILNHSGPGDSQMSSLFQANLEEDDFYRNPLDVAFGSRVTLKNMDWGGGLLHSHYEPEGPLRYLKDGDTIHLSHVSTGRNNLRSHTVTEPVSKLNYKMSGYWNLTVEDNHDYWQVEIVDDTKRGSVGQVHSLTTRMRFKHLALGCYLRAANAVLPQWGFEQIEVSCEENNKKDAHTYRNVESRWNDRLPAGNMKLYKSPFLRDFWTSNNALILLTSKPFDWPFLRLGMRMCGWGDNQIKYYLMGTPVVWWGSTISLGVALLTFTVYILRWQRKYNDMDAREWDHFLYVGKIAFFEWAFHYVPFLIMGRVTYLHHYLPTLYFAVLMFGHVLDHFIFSSRRFSTRTKATAFGVLVSDLAATFWWFSGVALGIDGL
ncbi:glycosyltransferase family 39 protein [Ephemerocybe angulata]|uniref:Dolichyl-phosphate-mannose--protein mannosyltransferase n=1 Tax=Ephemerocybe angulata TaxID=980116 RepID=A0A8H6IG43_9AGAR|nr:glycosyltransferase family 39 protein [Tulosesus angulatus]